MSAAETPLTRTTLPSPVLRTAAVLAFLPSLPLCITHGALSSELVPALGLVPLSFSAGVSLFLLLRSRRRGTGKGKRRSGERGDLEGLVGAADASASASAAAAAAEEEGESEGEEGREGAVAVAHDGDVDEGGDRGDGESVLTHRILVFVVDLVLAAALLAVLVFTWIRTGTAGDRRPELAMLAAYSTMPLLVNFSIHSFLAVREFVAGLAIPSLVEYTAWRLVPPNCPHCGSRLRPDTVPPIPWYETVSRPKVSLPRINTASISRPSLPAFRMPKFSGLKGPREWKVPKWMRGRGQDASLFVDDEQHYRDQYSDDPDAPFDAPSGRTTVVATGSARPAPVEEVVVGKRERRDVIVGSEAWAINEDDHVRT
ncbi:hypothetical protein MYCTH_2078193 [Thermothelomyces thermophilus ATCC 42464]|uniref:Uncharacterized protein n=1 Tax=Thermothelomyces thermophilus (strain ATCC 42464 / BCRC 31852 / DSM 1799) TaxID=573729 RepID=G2QAB6_THET4|nr:uncharacterized protein MYCTH_2078193 [Thermothelomyces thermophilus ATCC 42464]AEO56666.1 hypothetical protein MYCTH_2078193 [Thermothelomyces thermophilus ATCC 42464]